jgi:hypothetical protein
VFVRASSISSRWLGNQAVEGRLVPVQTITPRGGKKNT